MPPLIRRTALVVAGAAAAGAAFGLAVGVTVRLAASGPRPAEGAAGAMTVVAAAALVVGACTDLGGLGVRGRLRAAASLVLAVWSGAAAAGIVAGGGAASLGAATVAAAWSLAALGARAALGAARVEQGVASYVAAALASVPAALLFVADPWIEWEGSRPASAPRAAAALRANPLGALTSHDGGLGVDWQRMPLLYDGAGPGVPGLSYVGQYYPSAPSGAFAWSAVAGGIGLLLVAAARNLGPCSPSSS